MSRGLIEFEVISSKLRFKVFWIHKLGVVHQIQVHLSTYIFYLLQYRRAPSLTSSLNLSARLPHLIKGCSSLRTRASVEMPGQRSNARRCYDQPREQYNAVSCWLMGRRAMRKRQTGRLAPSSCRCRIPNLFLQVQYQQDQ